MNEVIMLHELFRLRAEYLEMPGLRMTREQAQRLCGLERTVCERVLDALVDAGFLYCNADGSYARVADGAEAPRPKPAKATLGANRRLTVSPDRRSAIG